MQEQPVALPAGALEILAGVADAPVATVATVASGATIAAPVVGKSAAPGRMPKRRLAFQSVDHFVVSRKHGKSFAVLKNKGFPEVLAIGSPELNARIRALARAQGESLKQRDLDDINEELRSEADASGLKLDLYPRAHPLPDGGVEIDLNDGAGTTVQLADGRVDVLRGTSSALFTRSSSALPLAVPADQGDYTLLSRYVNLEWNKFLLYIAWIAFTIAAPKIEATKYVFLVLKGTQGTGKTFASKTTQRVIDPNAVGAQTLPTSARDLAIMLQSVHLLVVDNLRDLTPALSDTLCIAATGGSVPMRKLYTDDEQKALHLHGAIVFNGIHPFMGQSDFADRCLVLELSPIPPEARQSEGQMLAQFEVDRPVILRGLYDLIVKCQQRLPDVQVVAPSRMLDFCRWLAAMEDAIGLPLGQLQNLYADSLRDAQLESLLDNPLAVTIMEFAGDMQDNRWEGTPADLYERLTARAGFSSQHSRGWPSSAAVLSKRLHGLQAPLLSQGIALDWTRGKDRQICIQQLRPHKPTDFLASLLPPGAADAPPTGDDSALKY